MFNQNEILTEQTTETFYFSEIEIPEAPEYWVLNDFEDLVQGYHSGYTHNGLV